MTNNYKLSYKELLDLTNEISPHQWCSNFLMTEVYKCPIGLSPCIMNGILVVSKHQYNTRYYNLFVTDRPKLTDMVEIQFHIELIRYETYCLLK